MSMIYIARTIRIWGLLILTGLLAGCGISFSTLAQPVSTPVVLEEPTPVPTSPAEEEWLTFTDETRTLSFQYPPSWTVLAPAAVDLDTLFVAAEIALTGPFSPTLADQRLLLAGPEKWSAFGFLSHETETLYTPNFTVSVVDADPLPLDLYLNLTANRLSTVDGITIEESAFVGNLRPGGMEIPSLRYTLTGALAAADLPLKGWQIAFYDEPGDHLILFTFSAAEDQFADLSPIFTRIVGSARIGNSWGIDGDLPSMPTSESLSDRCVPNRWWSLPLVGVDLTVHMPQDWALADMTDPAVISSTISSLVADGADDDMVEDVRNGAQVAVLHGELDDATLPDFATQMTIFFIEEATLPLAAYLDLFGLVPDSAEIARISNLDQLRGDGPVQIRHFEIVGTPTLTDIDLVEIRYAFADPQGERAIVVVFLTSKDRFAELQLTFEQIVACLSLTASD
jgi:hypothetical protein